MTDDYRTPCCDYDTGRDQLTKFVIRWNPGNRVVQCHNCGQVYIAIPDEVVAELILLSTDEQMAEAYKLAGQDMNKAAEHTRKVLLEAVARFEAVARLEDQNLPDAAEARAAESSDLGGSVRASVVNSAGPDRGVPKSTPDRERSPTAESQALLAVQRWLKSFDGDLGHLGSYVAQQLVDFIDRVDAPDREPS